MRYLKLLLATLTAALLGFSAFAAFSASAAKATPTATGTVQVCKVAAAGSSLTGLSFPFQTGTWSGSYFRTLSLTAGPAPGGCQTENGLSGAQTFTVGTLFAVEEGPAVGTPQPGVTPTFTVSNSTIVASVPSVDLVIIKINAGVNVVTATNISTPPGKNGTLELCKDPGDIYVHGTFGFNLTGPGGFAESVSVPTGQCNNYTVPSGTIAITEPVIFPYALSSVNANPSTALMSSDLDTQCADVDVQPNATTDVHFVNDTLTGFVKVCKTLDRALDNVLAGTTFNYSVSATFQGAPITVPSTVAVTAIDYPTQTCVFLGGDNNPTAVPLGSTVTVTETGLPADGHIQAVESDVSPASLDAGSTSSTTHSLFVGNLPAPNNVASLGAGSITQVNFTNEAFGWIEVCKSSNTINQGIGAFQFSVNGVALPLPLAVGGCSPAQLLPVGTTSITEAPTPHVTLTGVTGAAWTPGSNTATATVVFNQDNIVTFENEVNTGTLKICKQQTSQDANLQNTAFNLTYGFSNGLPGGSVTLKPGQCSGAIPTQIVTGNLVPVTISITEGTSPIANVALTGVSLIPGTGGDTIVTQPTYPHLLSSPATVVLNSLEGTTQVTFTNGIDNTPVG